MPKYAREAASGRFLCIPKYAIKAAGDSLGGYYISWHLGQSPYIIEFLHCMAKPCSARMCSAISLMKEQSR